VRGVNVKHICVRIYDHPHVSLFSPMQRVSLCEAARVVVCWLSCVFFSVLCRQGVLGVLALCWLRMPTCAVLALFGPCFIPDISQRNTVPGARLLFVSSTCCAQLPEALKVI
jgi:hypothetical protein